MVDRRCFGGSFFLGLGWLAALGVAVGKFFFPLFNSLSLLGLEMNLHHGSMLLHRKDAPGT